MRPTNWPTLLDGEIRAAREAVFAWGTHDCFLWAARVVRRLGGPDIAADVGTWHDEASATAAIARWGADLEAGLVAKCAGLGMQEMPPAMAQRGDLVVLSIPRRPPLAAICAGRDALAPAPNGLAALPMRLAVRAWVV